MYYSLEVTCTTLAITSYILQLCTTVLMHLKCVLVLRHESNYAQIQPSLVRYVYIHILQI